MLHWRGLTTVTHESFAPLVLYNRDAAALFVRSDAPWATLGELEAHIKASPGALKASGSAQGGIWHLALAGWYAAIGEDPAAPQLALEPGGGLVDGRAPGRDRRRGLLQPARGDGPDVRGQGALPGGHVSRAGDAEVRRRPDLRGAGLRLVASEAGGCIGVPRDTPEEIRDVLVPGGEAGRARDRVQGVHGSPGLRLALRGPAMARATLVEADQVARRADPERRVRVDPAGSVRARVVYPMRPRGGARRGARGSRRDGRAAEAAGRAIRPGPPGSTSPRPSGSSSSSSFS